MPAVHDFDLKKRTGEQHAQKLDEVFSDRFKIERVGMPDEWRGIDRVFTNRESGRKFTVEYKADERAEKTHNIFVETVSNDKTQRPGWAHTCQSAFIMYYIPGDELIYVVRPRKIRDELPHWKSQFVEVKSKNDGYNTLGVLVPLCEFERIAVQVVSI
jgi:hypothetical protein